MYSFAFVQSITHHHGDSCCRLRYFLLTHLYLVPFSSLLVYEQAFVRTIARRTVHA